ncbi:MAG: cryptochrome/photolyase family protein [Pirellulaceae bacterium]
MHAALIYPHQLFTRHPALESARCCVFVEEPLFFRQYRFHAHKLVLHRASMRHYADRLRQKGLDVRYVESAGLERTEQIGAWLTEQGIRSACVVDPCDAWLEQRLRGGCERHAIELRILPDPDFLTPWSEFESWGGESESWYFHDFYIQQRKRLELLLDSRGKPIGGKWSFDRENRKKLPKGTVVPSVTRPAANAAVGEARDYVAREFPAYGDPSTFSFPVTRDQALTWLDEFLESRFEQFGVYEDSISSTQTMLFHSVLTPMLNIGLLSPREVVDRSIEYADRVPLNSLEGFVRQVIGWREFIRGVYKWRGTRQRTTNFWGHTRRLPSSFYDGTTGIVPFDTVVRRVLDGAYCHHIERLMIAGNFMLLCGIDPDDVYRWFMELFIDAYDWVMVPNVYGMSQHADGGLMTTSRTSVVRTTC